MERTTLAVARSNVVSRALKSKNTVKYGICFITVAICFGFGHFFSVD